MVYELRLDDETEKVVEADETVDVGDALMLNDEIWLVLCVSECAAVRGRSRFECRRALQLRNQAQKLVEYAKELDLKFTEARELRSTSPSSPSRYQSV